jgi:MFS family permease
MSTTQPGVATPPNQRPWIFDLTAAERSTLVATFGGWALDGMDVMVYSFVIPTLIAAWHISKGQAGLLGTAALLISALGGWLAGCSPTASAAYASCNLQSCGFALFTSERVHQLVLAIADDRTISRQKRR